MAIHLGLPFSSRGGKKMTVSQKRLVVLGVVIFTVLISIVNMLIHI